MSSLQRVCLVTGGGGARIGQGICLAAAQQGLHVIVADADFAAADKIASRIQGQGESATALRLDVSDPSTASSTLSLLVERIGPIGALVNSAGVGLDVRAGDVTAEAFDRVTAVNVRGAWLCTRALLPGMEAIGGGSIVNIGSVHSAGALPGYSTYAASKAALVALTRGIAYDYGRQFVRCNVVHPGAVLSPDELEALNPNDPDVHYRSFVETRQMLPQPITPSDIGQAVAFLLSPQAAAITGAELFVDAGTSAMLFDQPRC